MQLLVLFLANMKLNQHELQLFWWKMWWLNGLRFGPSIKQHRFKPCPDSLICIPGKEAVKFLLGVTLRWIYHFIHGGIEIFLVTSCYRN